MRRSAYDADGRLVRRVLPGVYDDTLVYSPASKVEHVERRHSGDAAKLWYDALGRVVAQRWTRTNGGEIQIDEYRYDPHGNLFWSKQTPRTASSSTGRLPSCARTSRGGSAR